MSKRDRIKNNSRSIREDRAAVLPPSLEDEMDTRLFPPTLAPDEEGVIRRAGFVLDINKQELRFEGHQLDQDLWVQMGQYLQQTKDAVQWMIGDWCLLGFETMDAWLSDEDRARIAAVPDEDDGFPQGKYKWLSEMTDYKYSTLRKFSYFSSVFGVFRRRNTLTYSHHVEVAHLPEQTQERLLDNAEPTNNRKRLSVRDLREMVKQEMGVLPEPNPKSRPSAIYQSLARIQQELTPASWNKLSPAERRQIHNDLKVTLAQIEELGID